MDTKKDNPVTKAVKDVRDATRETLHRSSAEGERSKRELAGDAMTPSEKIASGANEAKHRVQAEVDKGKRGIRDRT